MVAIYNHPDIPLESAIRFMHPFPIFERYVSHDIILPLSSTSSNTPTSSTSSSPSSVVIKGNTQVIMFTSDFLSSSYHWSIFGAGERICSGMHYALPFLKILSQSFHQLLISEKNGTSNNVLFRPELSHRYSGRNNDGKSTISELVYLISLVMGIFYRKIMRKFMGRKDTEEEDEEEEIEVNYVGKDKKRE